MNRADRIARQTRRRRAALVAVIEASVKLIEMTSNA